MRFLAYIVAVLIAAGMIFILGQPPKNLLQSVNSTAAGTGSNTTLAAEAVIAGPTETVALDVPGMHCVFACYPQVKKTLEGIDGVQGVELAQQPGDELTDKTVFVSYTENFELASALESLKKAGFEATEKEVDAVAKPDAENGTSDASDDDSAEAVDVPSAGDVPSPADVKIPSETPSEVSSVQPEASDVDSKPAAESNDEGTEETPASGGEQVTEVEDEAISGTEDSVNQ